MIKAVVGAGGKTSLIKRYAKKYQAQGKKVFVTTSTRMFIEEHTLLTDDADVIIRELKEKGYAMAGIPEGQKIKALSEETYRAVCAEADAVLVEADGSKHMPVKFPAEYEPIIDELADEIIIVCGLHALGKPAKDVCHRLELVKQCLHIKDDTIIQAEHVQQLVRKGYMEPLMKKYPDKKIMVEPAGADTLYKKVVASLLAADMDVSLVKEEWFCPQPHLIICGGGHVSGELVKMASCLDFHIKVMDDREEFANPERFPLADEVICDSFENLGNYLEPNGYYCVVTRGHKDDLMCVKTILDSPYEYLGMIGSRIKTQHAFENLRKSGVSEEQIGTIFAPIGLPIRAVTPAEIAVSILAQIIQEKNKKHISSASRELLHVQDHGTLCIIIEKTGSSPRGVGSMMFVGKDYTLDSIGGGAVEVAAIEEARRGFENRAMLREYHLNHEHGAELGMVCGGSNQVLFVSI